MSLQSMTGFGSGESEEGGNTCRVELRSVNGRFLKLSVKSNIHLGAFEAVLERKIRKEGIGRGSVTCRVTLLRDTALSELAIDEQVAKSLKAQLEDLALPVDAIPLIPGVVSKGTVEALTEGESALVEKACGKAIEELTSMQEHEGQLLEHVIRNCLQRLHYAKVTLDDVCPVSVKDYQQRFTERVSKLVADIEVSADRLAQECAVLAERFDVTEELDRLGAHLNHFEEVMRAGDDRGKTLEFITQELGREVNTIGAKSHDADLSRRVVEMKGEVEKIREQLANIA